MSIESSRYLRFRKYQEQARRADQEITSFWRGEPSEAFFAADKALDVTGHMVFDARAEPRGRSGDRAKRSGEIINTYLENPGQIPPTPANLSFVERHFPRLLRFSKTAKNKGRLHPEIKKILGL